MRTLILFAAINLLAPVAWAQFGDAIETARGRLGSKVPEASRAVGEATVNLVYDDGEVDNGLAANSPHAIEYAMRFDAGSTGSLVQVQICFSRLFSFDDGTGAIPVGIYALGSGGAPGSMLHAFSANINNFPTTGLSGQFRTFILPTPAAVPASFFIGVEMDSLESDLYLCVDEDGSRRPIYGSLNGGPWVDLAGVDPDTKKLMIRAQVETGSTPPPPPPPPGACSEDATTACLLGNRFRATVRFRNGFDGAPADTPANRKSVTGFANPNFETAFFYFNSPDNIEVMLKMLDQGNTNGAGQPTIAVLTGTATPLRVEITITDTQTGVSKVYVSPFPSQQGLTDFTAFVK